MGRLASSVDLDGPHAAPAALLTLVAWVTRATITILVMGWERPGLPVPGVLPRRLEPARHRLVFGLEHRARRVDEPPAASRGALARKAVT